ncbi:MAG TPA: hypothetical protein VGH42_09330, partial [Verrucomicrobiae bacterium]
IVLFIFAVAIGAVNLLRLKPQLLDETSSSQNLKAAAGQLRFNVSVELFLGTTVVIVVAILGILPPSVH